MSTELAEAARRADRLVAQGRDELVGAVRAASAAGMTQAQIAAEIGRSQPEVSRLLHFHGPSRLGLRLRRHAPAVRKLVSQAGGSHVRVFGSVARGTDGPESDIDLLFTMNVPLSLMELGALERTVSDVVGARIDLVPESALRPELAVRVLTEAVPL